MSELLHPARYAASRPWAKRVAHLFANGGSAAECEALLARSLAAAPGGVGLDAARQEVEMLLAHAYGRFVRHGRQALLCSGTLGAALDKTRPPRALPVLHGKVAPAFFIALPDMAGVGAFVCQGDTSEVWQVLLLPAAFARSGAWWQRNDEVLALTLRDGDSLELPELAALLPWKDALYCLFNRLAALVQTHCGLTGESLPQGVDRAAALRDGKLPVQQMTWRQPLPGLALSREGYWRQQGGQSGRLVWVPPR